MIPLLYRPVKVMKIKAVTLYKVTHEKVVKVTYIRFSVIDRMDRYLIDVVMIKHVTELDHISDPEVHSSCLFTLQIIFIPDYHVSPLTGLFQVVYH